MVTCPAVTNFIGHFSSNNGTGIGQLLSDVVASRGDGLTVLCVLHTLSQLVSTNQRAH